MSHVKKNFHLYSVWNESVSQKGLLSSELTWWIKQIFSELNIQLLGLEGLLMAQHTHP